MERRGTGVGADRRRDPRARRVAGRPLAAARGARPRPGRRCPVTARPTDAGGWTTVAPSAVAFEGFAEPVALDTAGIDRIVEALGVAAVRAVVSKCTPRTATCWPVSSPAVERRDGGSLHNRARLLLRIVETVRAAAPQAALVVRFSASDWADGPGTPRRRQPWAAGACGAVLFDISSGGLVAHQRITTGPGYQVPLAAEAACPVSAWRDRVGRPGRGGAASGDADVILAGREWLRNPHSRCAPPPSSARPTHRCGLRSTSAPCPASASRSTGGFTV
ncbi:hypothetical protein [Microbacterium aurum]